MVTYPRVAPVDHAIGINAYAWAMFVESVISASILFITPMLPFKAPFRLRLSDTGKNGVKIRLRGKLEGSLPDNSSPEGSGETEAIHGYG